MPSLADIGLDAVPGVRLQQAEYNADFAKRDRACEGEDIWKLERRQDFQEPDSLSWEAAARGDWELALRLLEERRDELAEFHDEHQRQGVGIYRVRIVEEPIIPYVRWELRALRLRAEYGEQCRVLAAEAVRHVEKDGPLPELVNVGAETLYEIRYDAAGIADGAVRYIDPGLVARYREFCRELHEVAEDVRVYTDRKVADLSLPTGGGTG